MAASRRIQPSASRAAVRVSGSLVCRKELGDWREELIAHVCAASRRWRRRKIAHAEQQLDEVGLMLERCLPCLVRFAIRDHDGAVRTTKDERRARRGIDRLDERGALFAERVGRLRQEKAEQFLAGQRIVYGNFGECLQQDPALAGLVQPDERCQRFVAELRSDAPARQQREVHGPVANVAFLALDEDELFVRESAQLVLDGTKWLIEEDLGRVLRVTSRRHRENRRQARRENAGQCTAVRACSDLTGRTA